MLDGDVFLLLLLLVLLLLLLLLLLLFIYLFICLKLSPSCRDEISTCPAGKEITVRLHWGNQLFFHVISRDNF